MLRKSRKKHYFHGYLQQNFILWFWKLTSKSYSQVIIFGLNKHTTEMLKLIFNLPNLPKIVCISEKKTIFNIFVELIKRIKFDKAQAVIISSDYNELSLAKKLPKWIKRKKIPVIKMYKDYLFFWLGINSEKIKQLPNKNSFKKISETPDKTYIICSSMRSGSTFLGDLLTNTSLLGSPNEHFGDFPMRIIKSNVINYQEFIRTILSCRQSSNRIFGTKMHYYIFQQFENFFSSKKEYEGFEGSSLVDKIFPNVHYIFLTRKDKISQAVSLYKANNFKIYTLEKNEHINYKPLAYNFKLIKQCLKKIEFEEEGWKNFFKNNNIRPLVIIYEDLVKDPTQTCIKILNFMNIPVPNNFKTHSKFVKMFDELSQEFVSKFSGEYLS
ncbi:sulfotransferase [Candidatus Woesearchaeota archaeon]|nr:sulfotransferase [Candidatus Woesearchaeota archaeon]